MVLTKDELIKALHNEVRVLLHLVSKVEPAMLDYRPTPKQRSLLELLQYLTIMPPIHLRGALAERWDMDLWRNAWNSGEAEAKQRGLEEVKAAIAAHTALITDSLDARTDEDFREQHEMFGVRQSRGAWLTSLVLCHYASYRMQLFLYLKSCGREELNTLNLWVGMDAPSR